MTWSDRAGLSGDPRAFPPAGGDRARPGQVSAPLAATQAAADSQERIGQLLGDAVNLLLKAGLQLASVRCRLKETDEQQIIERIASQIDAALVDIRHLSVRVVLAAQTQEDSPNGAPRLWP
jgi:hypothetical protein